METSNMKNIIVLKNLPSNIIDEAIIIFKETQKITEKELIKEKNNTSQKSIEKYKSKEMIINETNNNIDIDLIGIIIIAFIEICVAIIVIIKHKK